MEFTYEALDDDDVIKEIIGLCSGPMPVPKVKVLPSGMVPPPTYLKFAQGILDLEVREDDVWVVTLPRCGTTLIQEMVWILRNNFNFEEAKSISLPERFAFLEGPKLSDRSTNIIEYVNKLESPRNIKTHLHKMHLPKELWTKKPKIVYIFRNPKDAAISLYYFYRLFNGYSGSMELILKAFLQDKAINNPFWEHVLEFWKLRKEPHVLFLTYEEMNKDLAATIRKLADFLGVTCTEGQVALLQDHLSFPNMKANKSVNYENELIQMGINRKDEECFIRNGEVGAWRRVLSPEVIKMFDDWTETKLQGSDFPREYI